jgi:2-keto-3-deoxy-L-rhamnonate aldolase RhmA
MTNEDMLAKLMAQANTQGTDLVTLRAIVEESSELGANRVLDRLGLDDEHAQGDLDELRELLSAWRAAKASATRAVIEWAVRAVMALLLIGIAVRLGVADLLR